MDEFYFVKKPFSPLKLSSDLCDDKFVYGEFSELQTVVLSLKISYPICYLENPLDIAVDSLPVFVFLCPF